MDLEKLKSTAQAMVAPGKGILAMDESSPTCQKRFDALGIPSTEEMRREYRTMLVTTPALSEYIGGAILFDETLRDNTLSGKSFVEVLEEQGVVPGIKVDTGAKELALRSDEKVTEGLDGLGPRLAEYAEIGARFEVAGGLHGNRCPAEPSLLQRQCTRTRSLCRALSGAWSGSHCGT